MDKEEFSKGNQETESPIAKGHMPLVHVEGRIFLTPEGTHVRSEWPLGPEIRHRNLFIEYERSFGRGLAKSLTHGLPAGRHIPNTLKNQLGQLRGEYSEMARDIKHLSVSGSEDEVQKEIQKIRKYRANYPDLYIDVKDPDSPKPKIELKTG